MQMCQVKKCVKLISRARARACARARARILPISLFPSPPALSPVPVPVPVPGLFALSTHAPHPDDAVYPDSPLPLLNDVFLKIRERGQAFIYHVIRMGSMCGQSE
jgi:hypothetical protein